MRRYGQFCPIARASEVLAERWTPILVRNLLLGCKTFNSLAEGAPGISRSLLATRLRELERVGVIERHPKPDGQGSLYELTAAGRELWPVIIALGTWGEKWVELTHEHADPALVLWSWTTGYLEHERLPRDRVVVRFDCPRSGSEGQRLWLLVEHGDAEVCGFHPGFDEDLVVTVEDEVAFARWHQGEVEWADAVRRGAITVAGPAALARALPTWNRRAGPLRPQPPKPTAEDGSPTSKAGDRRGHAPRIPGFSGEVLAAGDAGYETARAVWNGSVDRRPASIARCTGADDVAAAVRFARDCDLPLSVRGGGHSLSGASVCDGGVVVDLSRMRGVEVHPRARQARVEGGARQRELDGGCAPFDLATTGGVVSDTGVAGLTLGGGIGWLMRRCGLAVDNLLSAELVTADGHVLTASEHEHPELFWGLRGGGGNFGVVTSLTFRLHPIARQLLAGPVLWPAEDAADVLAFYRDFVATAPREVATIVNLRRAPQVPSLPIELHGRPVCIVAMCYTGDPAHAKPALAPLRRFGRPLFDAVDWRPYPAAQAMLDPMAPPGWHYYAKSVNLTPLDESACRVLTDHAWEATSRHSYTAVYHLGGAVSDVDPEATAYSHRHAAHAAMILGASPPQRPLPDAETEWVRRLVTALRPWEAGVYVNYLAGDDTDRVTSAYSPATYQRLAALKARYDPDNVFRHNPNIPPVDEGPTLSGTPR